MRTPGRYRAKVGPPVAAVFEGREFAFYSPEEVKRIEPPFMVKARNLAKVHGWPVKVFRYGDDFIVVEKQSSFSKGRYVGQINSATGA